MINIIKEIINENKDWILDTWNKIESKISVTSDRIRDGMPYTTRNGVYDDRQYDYPAWWTNSFWCGILWHMYKETGEEKYRKYAESIEEKLDEVLYGFDDLHHDEGFMWLLTSVMNYKITKNEKSRRRALVAASILAARGNIAGGYIRAWNRFGTSDNAGWSIIDSMMNIPILYWASDIIGDARFKRIADMHANKTQKEIVRSDGSVNHIVIFDEETGETLETPAGQGYGSGSSWARGQAWAIYGFIQSYQWTRDINYLNTAKKIAHYVISNLVLNNYIPLCDYRQPYDSSLLDSSAGAVTACGLIEIAKEVPDFEKALYLRHALRLMKALDEKCAVWDDSNEAILISASSEFHHDKSTNNVKNGSLIYGDYYFVEAVCKLKELIG